MDVKIGGRYRHYKGKEYTVIALGVHTETHEKVVIYRAEYDDPKFGKHAVWVRPFEMFLEKVAVGNTHVRRFTLID